MTITDASGAVPEPVSPGTMSGMPGDPTSAAASPADAEAARQIGRAHV